MWVLEVFYPGFCFLRGYFAEAVISHGVINYRQFGYFRKWLLYPETFRPIATNKLPLSFCLFFSNFLFPRLPFFWQFARPKARSTDESKCNGYFRSRNNLITGSSICIYNFDMPTSISNFDDSLQSTYKLSVFPENSKANDRIVDVSFRPGISKCLECVMVFDAISSVIRRCLRSKKKENLCFSVGKSMMNNASIAIWNFRRGLHEE